jgi:hypothetical protein
MTFTTVTFRETLRETIGHYDGTGGEVILSEGGGVVWYSPVLTPQGSAS